MGKRKNKIKFYYEDQLYKGICLTLIPRKYDRENARRYRLNHTNQNVWIPLAYLHEDGRLKDNINIDFVFRQSIRQLELAGYTGPIIGIKRTTVGPVRPSRKQLYLRANE